MRGLLAIEPLYHAIVAGTKTQTRRSGGLQVVNDTSLQMNGHQRSPDDWELVRFNDTHAKFWNKNNALHEVYCKPRYKVGEVLYLKEPTTNRFIKETNKWETLYKFGGKENSWPNKDGDYYTPELHGNTEPIWKNKLFMPASAARAFVRITGIKCEMLLDISNADCLAEGISPYPLPGQACLTFVDYIERGLQNHIMTAKESFISLYKFANKVKEVNNIFVWVYQFEFLPNYKI